MQLLRPVGLVMNVYDHRLALLEAEERPGKLAVVGSHRDDAIWGKFDGFNRDRKLIVWLAGALRGRLFRMHHGRLAKDRSGREQVTSCHNTSRLQEASAREERTRHVSLEQSTKLTVLSMRVYRKSFAPHREKSRQADPQRFVSRSRNGFDEIGQISTVNQLPSCHSHGY